MNNIKEYYKNKLPKFLQHHIPDEALGINLEYTHIMFNQCTKGFLTDGDEQCRVYYFLALIYRY